MEFNVNEKCIKCGKCINDCLTKALTFDGNKNIIFDEKKCIKCQHCLAICPTGALSINGKHPENCELANNKPESEKLLNLIKCRRSFRKYKHENLDAETMQKLKDMLHWVPTGVNNHNLHFAFIDDVEVMDDFKDYANGKLVDFLISPAIKKIKTKFDRYKNAFLRGEDVIFRGAPHMVVVSTPINAPCADIDPTIALSYFELYAQSMGVGTVWCGLAYKLFKMFPELCEYIEIPEGYKVGYAMLFGPSEIEYKRATQPEPYKIISVRKNKKQTTFTDKIKRYFWNWIR